MPTEWVFRTRNEPLEEALVRRLGIGSLTAQVLVNRGISSPEEGKAFLNPDLSALYDPKLLPDMDLAVRTIIRHLKAGSNILLYGDYDVDGMCSLAILKQFLHLAGVEVRTHIPSRADEGYGVHSDSIRRFHEEGVNLIVTVDCGVASVNEVAEANALGMEVVVTDHHEPGATRPSAAAVIDPKLANSHYPFKELAGVGVAFKLAWALAQELSGGQRTKPVFRDFLLDAMALVALGTVADVVPLLDENRVLAHFGLQALRYSQLPGIRALLERVNRIDCPLHTDDISFRLGPRLNVAGRMGDADLALRLLTTDRLDEAERIAEELDRLNLERQKIQRDIIQLARDRIGREMPPGQKIIVLADETWPAGIIGIVASHLVEEFYRPTVLISLDPAESGPEGMGRGSARSVPGLNIVELLSRCSVPLLSFGGHAQAAGMRIERRHIEGFARELARLADEILTDEDLVPKLDVDAEVSLTSLDVASVTELQRLAPFGQGATPPVLAARDVRIGAPKRVGSSGRHLAFYANQPSSDAGLRAIAYGMGDLLDRLSGSGPGSPGRRCDLAFVPKVSNWQGRESIELEIKDISFETDSEED